MVQKAQYESMFMILNYTIHYSNLNWVYREACTPTESPGRLRHQPPSPLRPWPL